MRQKEHSEPEELTETVQVVKVSFSGQEYRGMQSLYAYLLQNPFDDPAGLSLYVELQHMMAALMLGEWYE